MDNNRIAYIENFAPVLLKEMLKGIPFRDAHDDLSAVVKSSVTAAGLLFDELQALKNEAKRR